MSEKRFELPLTDAYTWIESGTKKPVGEFGKAVATIIGRAWKGVKPMTQDEARQRFKE